MHPGLSHPCRPYLILFCLLRLNPYAVDAYDGINLNPLEVVFIKVKSFLLQADWTAPKMSQTYDRWSSFKVSTATAAHPNFIIVSCASSVAF